MRDLKLKKKIWHRPRYAGGYKDLVESTAVIRFGDPMRDIYHFQGGLRSGQQVPPREREEHRGAGCAGAGAGAGLKDESVVETQVRVMSLDQTLWCDTVITEA